MQDDTGEKAEKSGEQNKDMILAGEVKENPKRFCKYIKDKIVSGERIVSL